MTHTELKQELGNIDIYLLDAIFKGRFSQTMQILDAGCGEGRNLHWFIKNGFDVYGTDQNADAILRLQYAAKNLNSQIDNSRFSVNKLEKLPYSDCFFDAVICNAVLHFAESKDHFLEMWHELDRVLVPNGILFIRIASNIGLEQAPVPAGNGKFFLPDGSLRFLLTFDLLNEVLNQYSFSLLEPVKTVNVQNLRCMTTLVLQKTIKS